MKRLKKPNWAEIALILVCLGVNLLGAKAVVLLRPVPLFLDSVGTVAAAVLGGYIPGILVGFLSNYINSASDPITLYYGICSILFALYTAWFAGRGGFRSVWRTALAALVLALIGGGLGSVLTWLLYGNDIGTGISAPLAWFIYTNTPLSKFFAQLSADLVIDVLDKLVTVYLIFGLLKLLPKRLLRLFSGGRISLGEGTTPYRESRMRLRIRYSLKYKVATIISITALILGLISAIISYAIYRDIMTERYIETGRSAASLMCKSIQGDAVDLFLREGRSAPGYQETEQALYELKENMPDIKYMYVYQIREDGCHVVFDLNTLGLRGEEVGTVVDFDSDFTRQLPDLLAGREIEPVVSKGQYGWLLTVYMPLRDAQGVNRAYCAADIDMSTVVADRNQFILRLIALLFVASVLIVAFVLWYADGAIVAPLNALADAAGRFAYDSDRNRERNTQRLQELGIRTGDEIENLFHAMTKTTDDMAVYVREIEDKTEALSRLKDNIILSFAELVESRDACTGSHIRRTAAYVRAIGHGLKDRGLYPELLTDEYLVTIEKSAPLHDIGKIKIPDAILNKPGRLTPAEYEVIKTHTTEGKNVLDGVFSGIAEDGALSEARQMAYSHHERWDGTGYPQGLRGEEIPLSARVMALADVFDALMSKRSYKAPFSFQESMDIIGREAGKQFDPALTAVFLELGDALRQIAES